MDIVFIFLFGLAVGSFLNVVADRLPQDKSLLWPPSYCPKCQHRLAWFDNIPLISFALLFGRCRYCKQTISWQYPLVELITAVSFILIFFRFGYAAVAPALMLFVSFLIIIFITDLKYYLILDRVVLPAIIIALAANLYLGKNWLELLLGAIIGGSFFGLQYVISKGKWLGAGDIFLGLLMGLMLGGKQLLVALFIAYFIGALVGIALIVAHKKTLSAQLPFGTFLSLATFITLLYGPQLLSWYLGLI